MPELSSEDAARAASADEGAAFIVGRAGKRDCPRRGLSLFAI
jgi:hypothetical protein